MKHSIQHTVVGDLPTDWKIERIKDLGGGKRPVVKAGPFGSSLKKEFYVEKGYKIYGQEQVISDDPFYGDYYIDEKKFLSLKSCEVLPGDLLMSLVGTVGKVLVVPSNAEPGIINPRLLRLSFDKKRVDIIFAKYYFSSAQIQRLLTRYSQGGTMGVLNAGILSALPFPLPPLPEQRKIADMLSTWDEAIAKTEGLITALQHRKKGLMQHLLTGEVRFAGFDDEWHEFKLGQIASKNRYSFTGGPFGSNLKAESYTSVGVRIIQLQNIGDGEFLDDYKIYTSEEKADELLSCNIYPGDIILSKMGDPVARATIIPDTEKRFLMASDGIRLEVDKKRFDTHFVLEIINAFDFRKNAIRNSVGSTRQRISLGDLRNLPIKAPTLAEQQKISSVLQSCNQEIEFNLQKVKLLKQQKKGLMQRLLTGQVRVKA